MNYRRISEGKLIQMHTTMVRIRQFKDTIYLLAGESRPSYHSSSFCSGDGEILCAQ